MTLFPFEIIILLGDNMKHNDMKNQNAIKILEAVKDKGLTIEEIMVKTDLSHVTVRKIGNFLCDLKYLKTYTVISDKLGRRNQYFVISDRVFSVYMYEDKYSYMVIGIDHFGHVTLRHDYIKRTRYTYEENFYNAIKSITSRPEYIYCLNIFANCFDASIPLFPDFVTGVRLKKFITENLSSRDRALIIDFGAERYISLYGHINKTNASVDEIQTIFPCDYNISYLEDPVIGMFDALQYSNIRAIKNNILSIKDL